MAGRKRFARHVLIAVVALLVATCAYFGIQSLQFHRAVRTLENSGLEVHLDPFWPTPNETWEAIQIRLGYCRVSLRPGKADLPDNLPAFSQRPELGAAFSRLAPWLVECHSDSWTISDTDATSLGYATELTTLAARADTLTDAGLSRLTRCSQLQFLFLRAPEISDRALPALLTFPVLKTVYLEDTQITDAGLTSLRRVPLLTFLSLSGSRITSAALVELATMPNLEHLGLCDTGLDDTSAPLVARLTQLKSLDLSRTRIGDHVCHSLARLRNLKAVDLRETNVTAAGIRWLEERHPDLELIVDPELQRDED